MTPDTVKPEDLEWQCNTCHEPLIVGPVQVTYLGNRFSAELPYCPKCKRVMISESIALGRMAEVEKMLEDK
jgi:hypothetical protein